MKRAELIALAERVEGLDGPDRVTDCDIRMAVLGDMPFGVVTDNRHQIVRSGTLSEYLDAYRDVINLDGAISDEEIRHYTASIDAAMTLVGSMQLSKVGELWDGTAKCGWATVHNYSLTERGMLWDDQHDVCAKTPALALTTAALRAIAAGCEE